MSEWQPIETAPKDNTDILLWERYSTIPFVGYWSRGLWHVNLEHVDAAGGWEGANPVSNISQDLIAFWMPLPEPPEDA